MVACAGWCCCNRFLYTLIVCQQHHGCCRGAGPEQEQLVFANIVNGVDAHTAII